MTKSKLIWLAKIYSAFCYRLMWGRFDVPTYRLSATNFAFLNAKMIRKLKYPLALYNTYKSHKRTNIFTKNKFFAAVTSIPRRPVEKNRKKKEKVCREFRQGAPHTLSNKPDVGVGVFACVCVSASPLCVCGLLAMTRELAFDLFFAAIWELESWPKITTGSTICYCYCNCYCCRHGRPHTRPRAYSSVWLSCGRLQKGNSICNFYWSD